MHYKFVKFHNEHLYPYTKLSLDNNFADLLQPNELLLKQILSKMSLEQKVGQLFHTGINGNKFNKNTEKWIKENNVGGIILFGNNFKNTNIKTNISTYLNKEEILDFTNNLQKASLRYSKIPLLISTDQENGKVRRLEENTITVFPSAMALGQATLNDKTNENFAFNSSFITAYELKQMGINWILAPVLDLSSNPKNPVVNTRSFGSDPNLVAVVGENYVEGNRAALSISAIKHFPGHGDTTVDSHFDLPLITKSKELLYKEDLFPFAYLIKKNLVDAVMCAHILFSSLDPNFPVTLSKIVIKNILRKELNFQGLIVSDAIEMKALTNRYKLIEIVRLAIGAGVDIILMSNQENSLKMIRNTLVKEFKEGNLSITDLDQAVLRQLRIKWNRGLFIEWENDYFKPNEEIKTYWSKNFDYNKLYYENLKQHQDDSISFDTKLARASIVSLKKDIIINNINLNDVKVFYFDNFISEEASLIGVVKNNIYQIKNLSSAFEKIEEERKILNNNFDDKKDFKKIEEKNNFNNFLKDTINKIFVNFNETKNSKQTKIFVIELPNQSEALNEWNKNIIEYNKKNNNNILLIAMYYGDPFKKIEIPNNGGVLLSFSESKISKKALIYRAVLPNQKIPKADLNLDN